MTAQNDIQDAEDGVAPHSLTEPRQIDGFYLIFFLIVSAFAVGAIALRLPPGDGFLWMVPALVAAGWTGRFAIWATLTGLLVLFAGLFAGNALTGATPDIWFLLGAIALLGLSLGQRRATGFQRHQEASADLEAADFRHLLSSFGNNGLALAALRRRIARGAGQAEAAQALEDVRSRLTVLARAMLRRADMPDKGRVSMEEAARTAIAAGLLCPPTELPDRVHIGGETIAVSERAVTPLMLMFHEMAFSQQHKLLAADPETSLSVTWHPGKDDLGLPGTQILWHLRLPPQNREFDGAVISAYGEEIIRTSRKQLRAVVSESQSEDGVLQMIFIPDGVT